MIVKNMNFIVRKISSKVKMNAALEYDLYSYSDVEIYPSSDFSPPVCPICKQDITGGDQKCLFFKAPDDCPVIGNGNSKIDLKELFEFLSST